MKLTAFKFIIQDAFYSKDFGLYGILEKGIYTTTINFIIDGKLHTSQIDNEEAFIQELLDIGILEWNQKKYMQLIEDGYIWELILSFDDIYLETQGINGFPIGFDSLMQLLHTKYQLPYLSLELISKKQKFKWHKKGNLVMNFHQENDFS